MKRLHPFSRARRASSLLLPLVALGVGCGSTLTERARTPTVDPLAARLVGLDDDEAQAEASTSGAVSEAPEAAREAPTTVDVRAEGRGFAALGDGALEALVQEALANQRDVVAALSTVERARALAMAARASRFPTANVVGTANAGRNISPGIGTVTAESVSVTLPIAYEVDLFGRFAREHRAASLRAEATEEDTRALALTVAAEVTTAYFDLVAATAERTSLEAQRALQAQVLAMVEARVARGLAPALDAMAQAELVATTDVALASAQAARELASLRLALLLGRSPSRAVFDVPASLPEPTPLPPGGVSADLLAARPDVRAALLRLEAADHAATAAVRAQLPILRIAVTPGYQALHSQRGDFEASASGFTWQLNGTLTVPLFDGLRARATVLDRRAEVDEQLRRFEQLVLEASSEVESAAALDRQARAQAEQLAITRALAARTREAVEASYREGLVDYVRVLLALRAELTAELSLLDARRLALEARVRLLRATGGGI